MSRDYAKEYREYHAKPEQKKNRAQRNAARSIMEKEGAVRKGDGKDVDHKHPIDKGGSNARGNLRVMTKSENRGRR
jgi:5-methylcytosine-specific restriction endonuclease McrA